MMLHIEGRSTVRRVLLPAVALVGLFLSSAKIAAETFTPKHVAKLRYVASAEISPDGSQVAYVVIVPRIIPEDEDGPAFTELHVVSADGTARPFVTGDVNVSDIAWTPEGTHISYLAKREGDEHKSLYVIPVAGGESRMVLSHKTDIAAYSWSPDGRRVAFLATEPQSEEEKELEEKGFNQEVYEEDLDFVRVWMTAVDVSGAKSDDEKSEPRKLDLEGSAHEVHWSPAGERLAVSLAPTPLIDDYYMRQTVHLIDIESGKATARLDHPAKLGEFAWSPDGRHVVTVSGEDIHDPHEGRLLLWSADGKLLRDLVPDYQAHVSAVEWKDDSTITFLAAEGVHTRLSEVNLAGTERKTLVPPGGTILGDLSLSDDGRTTAVVGDSARHPNEVFLLPPGAEQPHKLTTSNPWLSEMEFAPQEVVEYTARDGLKIQGILVRPLNEVEGRRYPLILTVHGGPESHVPDGWTTSYAAPGQVGAAEGFAVFYPNYRGSTGRGVEFSKMGQADAAGREFDDLVDAVDHLVETGLVDKDRVGITGGSYGGYASAWGATYYTERFAASVMFVGISDNVSKVGTTDIPYEMFYVHHRKWLWEDWNYFLERSPIRYVEKARTPLLILHGKNDPRVHPGQSLELFRHLKVLNKAPVRLVLYPGEGHGNRRAASRYDYNLRMMRWMLK